MKIKKEKNELVIIPPFPKQVIRVPLTQKGDTTYGKGKWEMPNLLGIIVGDEYSISQLIYLDYKDSIQEGMPIIMFNDKEELEEVCKKYGIEIWEHEICSKCKKVLRSCHSWGDKGSECIEHSRQ